LLTFDIPGVPRVNRAGDQHFPFTGIRAIDQQLRSAPIAQREPGLVRINACSSALPRCQPYAALLVDIDSIKTVLLDCQCCLRRINFKESFIGIKLC
jgi:hypothetical protein